ncbi:MAG: hypothetical protein ACKO5J_03670, partial [Rubrivivax sp.]
MSADDPDSPDQKPEAGQPASADPERARRRRRRPASREAAPGQQEAGAAAVPEEHGGDLPGEARAADAPASAAEDGPDGRRRRRN